MSEHTTWVWPLPGYSKITSGVGPRWGGTHNGIDIPAAKDSAVIAAREGTVLAIYTGCTHNYAKPQDNLWDTCGSGYGNYVYIDHGDGYVSRYAHFTEVFVSEGQTVAKGQLIGTVGSTGKSTGNHLHFEIRQNGNIRDPEKYVSPNGETAVSADYDILQDYYTESEVDLPAGYYGTVEAGGITVGQRVSGLTPQPVHAFINIWLGDKLLATDPAKPNIIQSFEYDRMEGTGERATFTVFDDNWEEIEYTLSKNWNNIYIEYGYYGTGVKSKLVKHLLQNYSISFESTGTILVVETVTEGVYDNLKPMTLELNTYNPTEAAKMICTKLGYKVLPENFDSSRDIHSDNPFNIIEDFPITYIQKEIIPQAAQVNEEIFTFKVDDQGYAYFKRITYNNTTTDTLRTYIYQKGYDSNVLDFTANVKAVFGGVGTLEVVTGYRSSVFDTKNKEASYYEVDKASAATEATGDGMMTRSQQSQVVADTSGYSPEQASNILYYNMKSKIYDGYEATLNIVGDPTVNINTYIRIINITDAGYLHHTSGVYYVLAVNDSIQSGQMTTTLKVVKNATAGDIDGLEIINPKLLIL